MLLACDHGCSLFQIKTFEVVLGMRGKTVMHEYPIL